jgi:tetratricopeptide (TPR) repeat protein
LALAAATLGLLTGCAREAMPVAPKVEAAPLVASAIPQQAVEPVVVRAYATEDLLAELERARALLLVEKHDEAASAFDRLRVQAGEPSLQATAAYHAGLAYEGLGNRGLAIERFRQVADAFGDQAIARNALVRLVRLYGRLERWVELGEAAERLLKRGDLPAMDQLEGRGAKALSLVELGDVDGATIQVGKALEIIDRFGFGQAGQPPVQVAQVMFAEGEIRRLRSETIHLVPVTPDFPERLDARCRGLLNAQSAYTEAIRARDSHWSAMSGFRVGQLYMQLHAEAMTIPPPPKATTLKQKQLFEGALRLRYRALLEKGLKMMEATVRLGDRTGEDSEWVARARESKRSLEQSLADEKRALASLPYTEEELRKGLDSLKPKGATPASPEAAKPKPGAATPTPASGGPADATPSSVPTAPPGRGDTGAAR